jgi:hypothetical protein
VERRPVDVLWTGGWDSTFLLLQTLLVDRLPVAPHYLLDPARPSLQIELVTMRRLRDRILLEHEDARDLLGPTSYHAVPDIDPDPTIAAAHAAIVRTRHLGTQWIWMPSFCKQHALDGICLGVHGGDRTFDCLQPMVTSDPHVRGGADCGQGAVRVDPRYEGTDEYTLFRFFAFPLFRLDKLEMDALARERGWGGIMEMTWFCHTPRRGTTPCGKCAACRGTIKSGMGRRIPASSRRLARVETAVTDPLLATARRTARRARERLAGHH